MSEGNNDRAIAVIREISDIYFNTFTYWKQTKALNFVILRNASSHLDVTQTRAQTLQDAEV